MNQMVLRFLLWHIAVTRLRQAISVTWPRVSVKPEKMILMTSYIQTMTGVCKRTNGNSFDMDDSDNLKSDWSWKPWIRVYMFHLFILCLSLDWLAVSFSSHVNFFILFIPFEERGTFSICREKLIHHMV